MKNLMTKFTKENYKSAFFNKSVLIFIAFMFLQVGNMYAINGEKSTVLFTEPQPEAVVNSVFADLINKIKMGHFFNATVTSLNEKTKGKAIDVYSSYGFTQAVDKLNDQTLELKNLTTSFSDREHFSGAKTVEKITIKDNGTKVSVEVTFVTWSNTKAVLTDVSIKKINMVTFITGYVVNGNNATYYTIALKDMGRII